MATKWYLKSAGVDLGPFTSSQLKKLAQDGRITADSEVRRQDERKWVRASDVEDLFPSQTGSQPKATPPPKRPPAFKRAKAEQPPQHTSPPIAPPRPVPNAQSMEPLGVPLYLWAIASTAVVFIIGLFGYAVFFRPGQSPTVAQQQTTLPNETAVFRPEAEPTEVSQQPPANAPVPNHTQSTTEEIVARVEPSIALIKGRFSSGTGFLVRPLILATNRHVISGELSRHITVHFPSASMGARGPYNAELLYVDSDKDLAFLSVNTDLPSLEIAPRYTFRRGQEVLVIGNPGVTDELVLENAISRGIMSTRASIQGVDYYQLGIAINPGNSGGPVIDMNGSVIGVVTLKASEQEGLGFSIPIEHLHGALEKSDALTSREREALRSQHLARVVFQYVQTTGVLYKRGMEVYADAMQESLKAGRSVNDGLNLVRKDVEATLSAYDEVLIGDLKTEVGRISTEKELPESARQRFVDLWANYLELKSYVENPRGTFDSFNAKYRELADKHDRLSTGLKLLLGVQEEE